MTQEQALQEFQAILPTDDALQVERNHAIGYEHGHMDQFYLWRYKKGVSGGEIFAHSTVSWEHALTIAKAKREECFEQDRSPIDVEVSA
jgi:hypothetical protein